MRHSLERFSTRLRVVAARVPQWRVEVRATPQNYTTGHVGDLGGLLDELGFKDLKIETNIQGL